MAGHEARVVLITGAAHRLGAASALALHARGWRVLLHYNRSQEKALDLVTELNGRRPDSCRLLQADLMQHADVMRLAAEAEASWHRVDALVNNASAFYPTAIGSITAAQWDELFASNARAPLFLSQALAPVLRRQRGAIVSLLDIHARKPLQGHTVYCMAKAAHSMLTLSLAKELAPDIRVNGIAPGAILWPSHGEPDPETRDAILSGIPLQRLGEPDDIARTVVFLLEEAPYITGQIIAVDGGRSL